MAIKMDAFPDVILRKIFTFLSLNERLDVELVSKRWYNLMPYNDITRLDLVDTFIPEEAQRRADTFPSTNAFLSLLKRHGVYLKSISFGKVYLLVPHIVIDQIDDFCPNLESLDLSYCTVTDNIVPSLMCLCDRLVELNFANTVFSVRNIDLLKDNMAILFSNCDKLKKINLQKTSVHNLTSVYFLPPTLVSLNLNSCSPLRADILVDALARCQDLEELRLSAYMQLDRTVLETICSLKKLKILELSHMAFGEIVFHKDQRETLNFAVITELTRLETLYVQYNNQINDWVFSEICGHCQCLTRLNVSYCRNLGDFAPLRWLTKLTELRIAAAVVTNAELEPLIKRGTLSVISATSCCCLDDATVKCLAEFCPALTTLIFNQCNSLRNETVAEALRKCRSLRELSLHAADIDNGVFDGLSNEENPDGNFPANLTLLDFSFCPRFDEVAVLRLNEFLIRKQSLKRAKLNFCVHQTKVAKSVLSMVDPSLLKVQL